MLSTGNVLYRIITNGIHSYMKNVAPMGVRTYHMLMSSNSLDTKSASVSLVNQTSTLPIQLGIASKFLTALNPIVSQVAGFKVKGSLRRRCKDCYFVMREQRLYVICKTHPRHKQMSMKAKDYKSWILTHATQSRIRPY